MSVSLPRALALDLLESHRDELWDGHGGDPDGSCTYCCDLLAALAAHLLSRADLNIDPEPEYDELAEMRRSASASNGR